MAFQGVRVQAKGQVTIPQEIRKSLNLKKGDLVVFEETDRGVLIKPVRLYADADLRAALVKQVREVRERFDELTTEEIESLVKDAVDWARDKND
jgi:AbrB family looped-hinge helix DNA binding protein